MCVCVCVCLGVRLRLWESVSACVCFENEAFGGIKGNSAGINFEKSRHGRSMAPGIVDGPRITVRSEYFPPSSDIKIPRH